MQGFFRLLPGHLLPTTFDHITAFDTDGLGEERTDGSNNCEMWTGQVITFFTASVLVKGWKEAVMELAFVRWFDSRPDHKGSVLDSMQNTDRVCGQLKVPFYDIIEADRILGPEFLVPSFDDESCKITRGVNFRKDPMTNQHVMRRLKFARLVGSAQYGQKNAFSDGT